MHLKSFLAISAYKVLTSLVAPFGAAFISHKKRKDPHYGKRIFELLGCYKEKTNNCIWFHGASVGEVNALKPLISAFAKQHPNETIVLSTMTTTGANAASSLKGVKVVFSPLDSPICVFGFFKSFNPKALIIIDTELWPNMLAKAKAKNCPVIIVNARMQEKNCQSYLKHKVLVKDLIATKLSKVLCVSHDDKVRFEKIGVLPNNILVSGNIKYDLSPRDSLFNDARKIKKDLLGNKVLGAISIHDGEEKPVLEAYLKAKEEIPDLKLVFVPRHQTTAKLACEYLNSQNEAFSQKSLLDKLSDFKGDILIGDTLGEIELYFGLCDLVFMGGSFVDIGGHNPLEPAYFSLPIITGPDYHNFKEQFDKLIDVGGSFLAEDENELTKHIIKLLCNNDLLFKTGVKALDVQQQGKGALAKTIEQLDELLYKKKF